MKTRELLPPELQAGGITRRDFLKFCSVMAVGMGLPLGAGVKMAEAIANPRRPPVIWLSFQECTGCVESLLRSNHPTIEHLILDLISLDYSETLSAAAGHQAEAAKNKSITENRGKFILVVDGAIPTKDQGIYCKIAGKTALSILQETAPYAAAVVAMGSCASWGGVAAAGSNPTGAKGVPEILNKTKVVSIPGCPPNPYNLLSTLIYYITYNRLPELDEKGRPKFAYSRLIHENCERRPHFDAGRFATQFGDDMHRKGACLYKLGCKGPETYANCPSVLFGETGAGTWPVGIGHPCFGCTEKGVGFAEPLHQMANVKGLTPPVFFGEAFPNKPGISPGIKALAAGSAGMAIGVGGTAMLTGLKRKDDDKGDQDRNDGSKGV
ncbi:hydrogenase small subunit [Geomesophilobacter sediminis]|uniref:Hydrogenase small subunit n=1 Tax=Geomesophilobacter sediminis TaxID=2798584 RepID=A0A8J7M358_9BACT|nr:hydrogenase small subunit [Geomesophilobacter sediminis]MBJ6727808.1 hydrogenase small subunit [Geomesophilobacter sediminis]